MLMIMSLLDEVYEEGMRTINALLNDRATFMRMYNDDNCKNKTTRMAGGIKLIERLDGPYRKPGDVIKKEQLEGLSEEQQSYVIKCAIYVSHYKMLLGLVKKPVVSGS